MSDNSNDCISNYYKQEYKPATSSNALVKEIDDYFNLSFLGDHVSRMQQAVELLQKCRAALEAADE